MPTTIEGWYAFYQQGGSLMLPILAIACMGAAIVAERTWWLIALLRIDTRRLATSVRAAVLAGDTARALRLCGRRRAPIEQALYAGVFAAVDRRRAEIAIDEVRREVEPQLEKRLGLLAGLASVAALIGLLGTIDGMTSGFVCGAVVTAAERARGVAASLGMAMNTSALGIMVAIALLTFRLVLACAAEKLARDLAWGTTSLLEVITVVREPQNDGSPYR